MTEGPRFSVAIPNYNYGALLGEAIESVLRQHRTDVEIHISDNCSTDDSIAVAESFAGSDVLLSRNRANVGMAANLDRAVQPTTGRWVITLNSDDTMQPGALDTYSRVLQHLGDEAADRVIVASAIAVIDDDGHAFDRVGPLPQMWSDDDIDVKMSDAVGCRVLRSEPANLLRKALLSMRNPIPFSSTMFPRVLYDEVEGYRGNRMTNADKWFHWRAIAAADATYYVDEALFGYRVHRGNEARQRDRLDDLKVLIDEYCYTLDVPDAMLDLAGLARADLAHAFIRNDVIARGLAELHAGRRATARRYARFGAAVYPRDVRRIPAWWALRTAANLGPLGTAAARVGVRSFMRR